MNFLSKKMSQVKILFLYITVKLDFYIDKKNPQTFILKIQKI